MEITDKDIKGLCKVSGCFTKYSLPTDYIEQANGSQLLSLLGLEWKLREAIILRGIQEHEVTRRCRLVGIYQVETKMTAYTLYIDNEECFTELLRLAIH